jgi:hypothetical protein
VMAATKRNAMLIAEARQKIKTTQLINRLQGHAFGDVEMSQTQIKATEILLRKSVPDLQSVQLQGDADGGALVIEFAERLIRARARAKV